MDQNASQSILMVGGMLLAISVLSFFVYAIAAFGGFANNMNSQIEGSDIQKHNQHFFQYESRYNIVFQDVISTINYAKDWNDQNDYSFEQVVGPESKKGPFCVNVYIKDLEGHTIQAFGKSANSWIKEADYSDNQKVKNVLNEKLKDSTYADYYYAVSVKSISATYNKEYNYHVLSGEYGSVDSSRGKDIIINPNTGYVEEIYFTAVTRSNYGNVMKEFEVKNKKEQIEKIEYKVQTKDYFRMTEIVED